MKRSACVAALLLATACFADLLVGPERNVPTAFGLSIAVWHDQAPIYNVFGSLTPGSDDEGIQRPMSDSLMIVADSAILGVRNADRTRLSYRWVDSTTTVPRDTIDVRGPVLAVQVGPTTTILIPLAAREDAAFLDHVVGDDIQLNFTPLGGPPYGFGANVGFWSLRIRNEDSGATLTLQGQGNPASPIVIPWQVIPAVAGDSLSATMQHNSTYTSILTAYPTFVHVFAYLKWHRRMVAAPSP